MSEKLCVVIPVYNERDIIGKVLRKWADALDALGLDYVIRPYNDGSRDDSLAVMRTVAVGLPRVDVRDKKNGGHGNTILTGYRDAADDSFDWVFQVDSDDEMGPEKFGELWSRREGYDFLVGIRDGRIQALPRKVISFVSRLCVRLFYGRSVWDVNTPYRLMRVSAFREYYDQIPLSTFAPNVILSGLAARYQLRCYETRVPQHDRTTGEVSIKKWRLLKAAVRSFAQTIRFALTDAHSTGIVVLLCCLLSFFCFGSNFVAQARRDNDSSVFMYIGESMRNGLLPYRDVFDHKGPFLYFWNVLGLSLSDGETWGVWIFECLLFAVGMYLLMSFVRKFTGRMSAVLAIIPWSLVFFACLGGGNMPEAYALLPYVTILLCCCEFIRSHRLSILQSFLIGLSIGIVLMMKFTLAVVGFPVAILYLTFLCKKKISFSEFFANVLSATVGLFLVVGGCVAYLALNGLVEDFVECYLKFNLEYASSSTTRGLLFIGRGCVVGLGCLVINLIMVRNCVGEKRAFALCNLGLLASVFVLVSLSPSGNDSYYAAMCPFLALPMGGLVSKLGEHLKPQVGRVCVVFGMLGVALMAIRSNVSFRNFAMADKRFGLDESMVASFKKNITNLNSVTFLGSHPQGYRMMGARTPWKYIYHSTVSKSSDERAAEINALIEGKVSEYIIEDGTTSRRWIPQLELNYDVKSTCGSWRLWQKKDGRPDKIQK